MAALHVTCWDTFCVTNLTQAARDIQTARSGHRDSRSIVMQQWPDTEPQLSLAGSIQRYGSCSSGGRCGGRVCINWRQGGAAAVSSHCTAAAAPARRPHLAMHGRYHVAGQRQ